MIVRSTLSSSLGVLLLLAACDRPERADLGQAVQPIKGTLCLDRPNVMICGPNSHPGVFDGKPALYSMPNDTAALLPVTEVAGCEPDANTQALLVTRNGDIAGRGAAWLAYVRAGGRIITEYNISATVYNELYGTAYSNTEPRSGACTDDLMPGIKLTPGHPFWQQFQLPETAAGREACGYDLTALVNGEGGRVVPLGGWAAGGVEIAARDDGQGYVALVDADWSDGESVSDPQGRSDFTTSRRLMGALISVCAGACGDTTLQPTEGCDDGNAAAGDGCNASCKIENGTACNPAAPGEVGGASCASGVCDTTGGAPGICEPADTCGNGTVEAGEICDDGNVTAGDGCGATCKIENGGGCGVATDCESTVCDLTNAPGICEPANTCGNGVLEAGEGCDDGLTVAGDGCSATCKIETGTACNATAPGEIGSASCESGACNLVGGAPGACVAAGLCGNGVLEPGEGCDDGNTTAADGCNATCKIETGSPCNATLPGDVGNASCESVACDVRGGAPGSCVAAGCGNGAVETGESCDDGNTVADDGCSATCETETTEPDGGTDGGGTSSGGTSSGGSSSGGSSSGGTSSGGTSSGGTPSTLSGSVSLSGGGLCSAVPGSTRSDGTAGIVSALGAVALAFVRRRRSRQGL